MSEAKPNQEPSMEEILASIRRIISEEGPEPAAGGDPFASAAAPNVPVAAPAPAAPKTEAAKPAPIPATPAAPSAPSAIAADDDEDDELVLTDVVTGSDAFDSNVVPLKPEPKVETAKEPDPFDDVELALDTPPISEPPMTAAPAFQTPDRPTQPTPAPRPAASLAPEAAVDPEKVAAQLSAELPDLVAPTVAEATTASFAQLLQQRRPEPAPERPTGDGLLVETLVRQAVEPMVKAWLDTHLEAIVEQMVRREVERLSRKAELS